MISPHDEALLTWFYSTGQTVFERSTMGPMLEHAKHFGNMFTGVEAREDRERVIYELACERIPRYATPWGRVQDGAIVYSGREVTARPTAETRTPSGYTPNLRDMEMHAEVTGVLRAMDWRAVAVLRAYYGDDGAEWARRPKPGRIGALFVLTRTGARMLEAAAQEAVKRGQPLASMSPQRHMANEVAAKQTDQRRVRLLQCERQALLLRAEACAAWGEARAELRAGRAA
jgi:hypothetical protein